MQAAVGDRLHVHANIVAIRSGRARSSRFAERAGSRPTWWVRRRSHRPGVPRPRRDHRASAPEAQEGAGERLARAFPGDREVPAESVRQVPQGHPPHRGGDRCALLGLQHGSHARDRRHDQEEQDEAHSSMRFDPDPRRDSRKRRLAPGRVPEHPTAPHRQWLLGLLALVHRRRALGVLPLEHRSDREHQENASLIAVHAVVRHNRHIGALPMTWNQLK
jgi:hypothetical protein